MLKKTGNKCIGVFQSIHFCFQFISSFSLLTLSQLFKLHFLPPSSNGLAAGSHRKAAKPGAPSQPAWRFAWFLLVIKKESKSC